MRFDNDIAWQQLKKNLKVATLRNYPYELWQHVLAAHDKLDAVQGRIIEKVENPTENDLIWFSQWCGFKSRIEWEEEARKLNAGKLPRFIFVVERVK